MILHLQRTALSGQTECSELALIVGLVRSNATVLLQDARIVGTIQSHACTRAAGRIDSERVSRGRRTGFDSINPYLVLPRKIRI